MKKLIDKWKKELNNNQDSSYVSWRLEGYIKQLEQAYNDKISKIKKEIEELRDNLIIQYDKEQGLTETESNINTNTLAHWKLEGAKRASRMFCKKAKQIVNQVLTGEDK